MKLPLKQAKILFGLIMALVIPLAVVAQTQTRPAVRNPHASLKTCRLAVGSVIKQLTSRSTLRVDGWVTGRTDSQLTLTSIEPITNTLTTTTVNYDQETEVVDRYRCYTGLNDVSVGDKVQAWATARTNGHAELIRNYNSWLVSFSGKVESPGNQTFTFVVRRHSRDSTVTTRVDSQTVMVKAGQPATFADLTNGSTIKLIGRWNRTTQTILATRIDIVSQPAP